MKLAPHLNQYLMPHDPLIMPGEAVGFMQTAHW
jgi:hypothetical protein